MSHYQWKLWRVTVKNILFIPAVVSVWILCPNYVIYSRAKWTACCCTSFLSFCGQQRKKKKWNFGLKTFIALFIQTYLQAMYNDMTETRGKRMRSVLSLSSIGLHFHSVDIMKKSDRLLPLNSIIVLFSASTSAPAESVIFISAQRCHTFKYIYI